jgi:hypothetical protein
MLKFLFDCIYDERLCLMRDELLGNLKVEVNLINRVTKQIDNLIVKLSHDDTEQFRELYCLGVFNTAVTTWQAFITLATQGYQNDSIVILRTLLEKAFLIRAIQNDPQCFEKILASSLNVANRSSKYLEAMVKRDIEDKEAANYFILKFAQPTEIDNMGDSKNLSIFQIAKIANMESDYNFLYSSACERTHSGIKSIFKENYCKENAKIQYNFNPIMEDASILILKATEYLLSVAEVIAIIKDYKDEEAIITSMVNEITALILEQSYASLGVADKTPNID